MSVLIIDDDSINQDVVKAILHNLGYESFSATNGADGLKILSVESAVRVILLDWNMPEMDGMEVLGKIRDSKFKHTPVIMMTAEDTAAKVKHALEKGADDYIVKPFNEETLAKKLQRFLTIPNLRRNRHT